MNAASPRAVNELDMMVGSAYVILSNLGYIIDNSDVNRNMILIGSFEFFK